MPGQALVLGAAGFLGRHLVSALARQGWTVRAFDRYRAGSLVWGGGLIEPFKGDFENHHDVKQALIGSDVVFHLVGTSLPERSNEDVPLDLTAQVLPTLRFLDLACAAGVRHLIYASSGGKVYGLPETLPIPETHKTDPHCAYGVHKLAVEKYLELYRVARGLDYRVLRISNAFGEGQASNARQGAVSVFLGQALRGELISIWGDGSAVRDYVHVDDVTRALCAAARYSGRHRIFNIGSGSGISVAALIAAVERLIGHRVARQHLPRRAFDVPANVLDIRRATACLDWSPYVTFEEGLQRTLAWVTTQTTTSRRHVVTSS